MRLIFRINWAGAGPEQKSFFRCLFGGLPQLLDFVYCSEDFNSFLTLCDAIVADTLQAMSEGHDESHEEAKRFYRIWDSSAMQYWLELFYDVNRTEFLEHVRNDSYRYKSIDLDTDGYYENLVIASFS